MRYAIAALVSILILASVAGWCRHTRADLLWQTEFGGELDPSDQSKLSLALLFGEFKFVGVFLVCGVSFGIAHWINPKVTLQESQS